MGEHLMIRGVFFGKAVMLYPRTRFFSLLEIRAVNEGSQYLATEVSFPKIMSKAVIGQKCGARIYHAGLL